MNSDWNLFPIKTEIIGKAFSEIPSKEVYGYDASIDGIHLMDWPIQVVSCSVSVRGTV